MDQKWEAGDLLGSYHILFETMSEGVFFQMANGTLVEVNPAALNLLGLARDEFIGRNTYSDRWDVIREDGTPYPVDELPSMIALKTGNPVMYKVLAIRNISTKQYVWIVANAIPQFMKGETIPYCVMVTMHDIKWHKSEEDIRKARIRILEYSQMHTLDELLTKTLDELERLTESRIGFYHFLEADQQTLSLQNWSSATLEKFCKAEGKGRHYNVADAGVWVDCIRQRSPIIHNNYASLAHRRGLPPGHAEVVRELTVPVFRGDKIVAILGVGNKPTDYTGEDMDMVSRFADLAWEIAERKRAEELLKENEKKFRVLFEELKEGVTLTHQGIVVDVNKRMTELLGLSNREDLIGKSLLDYMTPDSRQLAQKEIMLIQAGKSNESSTEFNFLRDDKTLITVDMHGSRVELGGRIYGLSVHHDVTERKNTEEKLKKSERSLLEAERISNTGSWDYDVASDTAAWSENMFRIFDVNPDMPDELVFKCFVENLVYPDDKAYVGAAIQDAIADKRPYDIQYRIIRKDGTVRWVHSIAETLFDEKNIAVRMIGKVEDITERKLAEAVLKQKIEELERFNEVTVERELIMIKLKKEINNLLMKSGEPEKYRIVE